MSLHVHNDVQQGTDEVWRTIPGFSADYEVSNMGRVRSYRAHGGKRRKDVPHLLATRLSPKGYLRVGLQVCSGKQEVFTVHSLVAAAFLGPRPEGQQVAHGDGDPSNARLENLRYATPLENARDKHLHGTTVRGERAGRAKLTEDDVREIRHRRSKGETQLSIARDFGISRSNVQWIEHGRNWSHVGGAA